MHALQVDDHRVRFEVESDHLGTALAQLSQFGVKSLVSHPPTLEELFLRHYRQDPPSS
jgi:ABC-2 type transport system ATP-binding protein